MKNLAYRHEYKFVINLSDTIEMKKRLACCMEKDPHALSDGSYFVKSLYFDNLYDKALKEKIDGVDPREKFRIRVYNNDDSFIRLEKKGKVKSLTTKVSEWISKEMCETLLKGRFTEGLRDYPALLTELRAKMGYEMLRPQTIVTYQREAFILGPGNIRVNLDRDIRSRRYAGDFFENDPEGVRASNVDFVVLEVKYGSFFPDFIADIVKVRNRMNASVSKYAACRVYT